MSALVFGSKPWDVSLLARVRLLMDALDGRGRLFQTLVNRGLLTSEPRPTRDLAWGWGRVFTAPLSGSRPWDGSLIDSGYGPTLGAGLTRGPPAGGAIGIQNETRRGIIRVAMWTLNLGQVAHLSSTFVLIITILDQPTRAVRPSHFDPFELSADASAVLSMPCSTRLRRGSAVVTDPLTFR